MSESAKASDGHNDLSKLLKERKHQLTSHIEQYGDDRPETPYRPNRTATWAAVGALSVCSGMIALMIFLPGWWKLLGTLGLILAFGLALPVLFRDMHQPTSDPTEIVDPVEFFNAFFYFIKHCEDRHAFRMLSPWARQRGRAPLAPFKELTLEYDADEITDHESLGDYWRGFLCSGDEAIRCGTIRNPTITVRSKSGSMALIEAEVLVRYQKGKGAPENCMRLARLIWLRFSGKQETIGIRKLLLRSNDRWYFAESEFSGELDRIGLDEPHDDSPGPKKPHWSTGTWH